MRCPKEIELQSLIDGELSFWKRQRFQKHLIRCRKCRDQVAELQEVISWIKKAALPDKQLQIELPVKNGYLKIKLALSAAMVLVALSFTGWWFYQAREAVWNQEKEIINQYLILHFEAESNLAKEDSTLLN